jgi:D-amino-acid oxidase
MGGVTVVGAGVIGLTVAHELAVAGHRVRVLAAEDARASVSAVAAAIWFPHDVQRSAQVMRSAGVTYERLLRLAKDPATGVRMRAGTVLSRRPDPDLEWTSAVPSYELLDSSQVPPGASGVRCTVPLVVTDVYLDWLCRAVLALGVQINAVRVRSLHELDGGDAVVVAAGLRSARLLGDDEQTYPIRGQVVRLANPGLTDWVLDDENPAGLTYVVPRDHDVVCGGTGEAGSWDEAVHPQVEAAILRRVYALVPTLRGQPVLSRAVGLRPARAGVRVEAVAGHGRPVFACYGHGGAGFTLSWGDAAEIVRLVESA